MAFKNIPLTIDTMIRNPVPVEGINQEDNVELNIVVTENKTPKDLSSQIIKVYIRRIDGTLVEQTNQITPTNARKGEVTVKLKNSAFNKEGYALFQLDISDSSGRITSSYATFKVGKGLVSGEAIANTNEIEALKKVEEYIKKANQELETFKQTVTEINENEASRNEAEKLRVATETGRVGAESLRVIAEEKRVAAETKREEEFNKFESKINANTKELKNARTATTGEKFNSLDERIDCEVDRLNKKIEVSFLQQEDKESHTIENTVEGMTTDMIIKGRTLQNLCKKIIPTVTSSGALTNIQDIYKCTASGSGLAYLNFTLTDEVKSLLQGNKKYTIFIKGYKLINPNNDDIRFYNRSDTIGTDINKINDSVLTFTTPSDFNSSKTYEFLFYCGTQGSVELSNEIILLEGDWTGKKAPEYFEGIKSFGQQEDKISILSHGKNLVKTELNFLCQVGKVNNSSDFECNSIPIGKISFSAYDGDGNKINDSNIAIWFKDKNKNNIEWWSFANVREVVLKKEAKYIQIFTNNNLSKDTLVKSIMITSEPHINFEPYKEDKKDILIKEPLRSVGNIQDVLYEDDGQVKINRYIKQYTFKGNENWQFHSKIGDYTRYILDISDLKPSYGDRIPILCDRFKTSLDELREENSISQRNDMNRSAIYLTIENNLYTPNNATGLNAYLKANPTTIVYQLATPVTEIVENCVDIDLKTFNEKTYVSFENAISGTSSFKAPVNTVATIARLNRENRALEEENKTLRQDFESTTLSLTDSDLELVKQNVDMDFRLMEVEFALDIPQSTLSSNINFKKKGEVKSMARTPYQMLKIVILSGDYDREDYIHKVGKYYERGRMTKEEYDELMSLMTADEVIGG